MSLSFQITIDCHDPSRLVNFWREALGYEDEPPPAGSNTWRDWYIAVGVPESELGEGDCLDRLRDPAGFGPKIWFQPVPEAKTIKNRIHFDLRTSDGREMSPERRREAITTRAVELVAAGAVWIRELSEVEGGIGGQLLQDPEGNEFCIS